MGWIAEARGVTQQKYGNYCSLADLRGVRRLSYDEFKSINVGRSIKQIVQMQVKSQLPI
jgi:hypothetical protein